MLVYKDIVFVDKYKPIMHGFCLKTTIRSALKDGKEGISLQWAKQWVDNLVTTWFLREMWPKITIYREKFIGSFQLSGYLFKGQERKELQGLGRGKGVTIWWKWGIKSLCHMIMSLRDHYAWKWQQRSKQSDSASHWLCWNWHNGT